MIWPKNNGAAVRAPGSCYNVLMPEKEEVASMAQYPGYLSHPKVYFGAVVRIVGVTGELQKGDDLAIEYPDKTRVKATITDRVFDVISVTFLDGGWYWYKLSPWQEGDIDFPKMSGQNYEDWTVRERHRIQTP